MTFSKTKTKTKSRSKSKSKRKSKSKKIKKKSTPERFELSHALHTALAGLRLNHSAKVPFFYSGNSFKYKHLYLFNVVIPEIYTVYENETVRPRARADE